MEEFLNPISEAEPSGTSLRYDPIYDTIREARRIEEPPDDSMGIWQPADVKATDWYEIQRMCEDVLIKRSKDLQIAYWRLEALLHMNAFAGLADGLNLCAALMETFWPTLHPLIDEDDGDLSFRLVPIRQMVQDLPTILYTLPITAPRGELAEISLFDYIYAKKGEGNVTIDDARKSFAATDRSWLSQTVSDAKLTIESLKRVEEVVYQHCGYDTPSFKDLQSLLEDILNAIKANVPEIFQTAQEDGSVLAEDGTTIIESGGAERVSQQDNSRVGAYRMLSQALRILEKAEPHSPVVVMLRHIVDWEVKGLHSISEMLQSHESSLAMLLKTFPEQVEQTE